MSRLEVKPLISSEGVLLEGNCWTKPPSDVVQGGWANIIRYYEALERSGATSSHRLKVVLVGAVCAGKTTLTRGLLQGGHTATVESECIRGGDIHITPWRPNPSQPLEVVIWDLAGHPDYYPTHQLLLTEGALQLLVVDLYKFHHDITYRLGAVYIWLDVLLCRIPECAVLVIATHADGFDGDRGQVDTALVELEVEIERHLALRRREWESAEAVKFRTESSLGRAMETAPSLTMCGVVEASGLCSEGLHRLRDMICRLAGDRHGTGKRLFPNVGQTVPVSWARVWAMAAALSEGAEPVKSVQLYDKPVVPIDGYAEHRFVTREEALEIWRSVVQQLHLKREIYGPKKGKDFSPPVALKRLCRSLRLLSKTRTEGRKKHDDRVFVDALNMRQAGGTLLITCGLVHLDPWWINLLLGELLNNSREEFGQSWEREMEDYCRECGLQVDKLMEAHGNFLMSGRLCEDYLRFLWRDVPALDTTVLGRTIDTMSAYGAMFPCGTIGEGAKEFVVPARLPFTVADDTLTELEKAISNGVGMEFTIQILQKYVPSGIIAQIVGWFYRRNSIVLRACWNKGASFKMGGREHLICQHGPTDTLPTRIEITIAGKDEPTVRGAGIRVEDELRHFLHQQFRGIQFVALGDANIKEGRAAWEDALSKLQDHLQSCLNQYADLETLSSDMAV